MSERTHLQVGELAARGVRDGEADDALLESLLDLVHDLSVHGLVPHNVGEQGPERDARRVGAGTCGPLRASLRCFESEGARGKGAPRIELACTLTWSTVNGEPSGFLAAISFERISRRMLSVSPVASACLSSPRRRATASLAFLPSAALPEEPMRRVSHQCKTRRAHG